MAMGMGREAKGHSEFSSLEAERLEWRADVALPRRASKASDWPGAGDLRGGRGVQPPENCCFLHPNHFSHLQLTYI